MTVKRDADRIMRMKPAKIGRIIKALESAVKKGSRKIVRLLMML